GLKAEKERLRIVLTKNPKEYQKYVVPGQLEFSDEQPKELVTRLKKQGFTQLLLVSGGKVATSFFKASLINELWLTLEPRIFGIGGTLVQEEQFDIQLQLLSNEILNKQGTLLLKYKVL
ncbi:dihydrofolate reductase family protein, partial [Candidatus Microgenomates bacterium]|nr:dihydrofolate reductase family protein [Candidatus Microgenomates bacterium]